MDETDSGLDIDALRVATLEPAYFAWVMASGIVSVGANLLGYQVLSRVVLGVTVAAFVILVVAYVWRAVWYPSRFRQSLQDPTTAIGYSRWRRGPTSSASVWPRPAILSSPSAWVPPPL